MSVRAIICGFVVGVSLSALATAGAAWLVTGSGETGARLARLSALEVSAPRIENVWPGDAPTVKATIKNPNERALAVASIALDDVKSDETGCATGTKFVAADDLVLQPGENDLTVGKLIVPEGIANRCQGATITGTLVVSAEFGQ